MSAQIFACKPAFAVVVRIFMKKLIPLFELSSMINCVVSARLFDLKVANKSVKGTVQMSIDSCLVFDLARRSASSFPLMPICEGIK